MPEPTLAIVGRPNVGKSTLFNRLVGERTAIVANQPGITRDRIYARGEWLDRSYRVIDTGGIELNSKEEMAGNIRTQAELAIAESDVILFLVDAADGVTSADQQVAEILRKSRKPVLLLVNKVDHPNREALAFDFYSLGFELWAVSAEHGNGLGDVLEEVYRLVPADGAEEYEEDVIRVSLIGRPNVGKSSLVNALLGEERVVVSPVAGTTRDAIDTNIRVADQEYVLIDTAGMRKRGKVYEATEKYSVLRALRAIERSDVVLIVLDGHQGIVEQDKRIAGYAHEAGKACLFIVNKWDIVEKDDRTQQKFLQEIRQEFHFMAYAPALFVSAQTRQRIQRIWPTVNEVAQAHSMRVSTSVLNDVVQDALVANPPPSDRGNRVRIQYATQVAVRPPTFVFFANDPERVHFSYVRYLENRLREAFAFDGTPVRLFIRKKN